MRPGSRHRPWGRSCVGPAWDASTRVIVPPAGNRCAAMSGTGPVSWSMSTSRSSPAYQTAAAGGPTDEVTHPPPKKRATIGYRFLHTALDDRTRLAYSEVLDDEQGPTAAVFWRRAHAWFASHGISIEQAITDNAACYRSFAWRDALASTSVTHKRTRPYRPQTNGKVERFHRILLEEWAHIRDW